MARYRIVEIKYKSNTWYEVEYKILFWWRTAGEEHFSIDGMGGFEAHRFNTPEQAEDFVLNKNHNSRKVVKEIITN